MFGIGLPELLVILGLALIVLGPEKLPQVAKQVARFIGELKKVSEEFKQELEVEELEKLKKPIKLDSLLDDELEKDILSPERIAKGSDDSDLPGGLDSSWKIAGGPASRGREMAENGSKGPDANSSSKMPGMQGMPESARTMDQKEPGPDSPPPDPDTKA